MIVSFLHFEFVYEKQDRKFSFLRITASVSNTEA